MSVASASHRDRSLEFQRIAEKLKSSSAFSAPNGGPAAAQPQPSGSLQSEFTRRASQIGLSIHQTSNKLRKLTELAKRTSIFDDPAVEIQELTAVIRQEIQALNAAIVDLQHVHETRQELSRNKHSNEHTSTVVGNLKSRLMDTTQEFKNVLTFRSESLKVHEERRKIYSGSSEKAGGQRFGKQMPVNGSTSRDLFSARRRPGSDVASSSTSGASSSGFSQTQAQTQQLVPVQDSYLQSRAEALRNVESTIAELGNIFTQLATMVQEQGEVALRIDEDMGDALANIEGAQGQLLKYLNSISSNRWLIIKIFFVLLVFLLIFVFFVA